MLVRKIWPEIPMCKNSFDEVHQSKTNQLRFQILQTKNSGNEQINGNRKTTQKKFQHYRLENAEWILGESSKFLLTLWSAKNELMTVFHTRICDKNVKPFALSIN